MSNYINNIRRSSLKAVVGRVLNMLPDDSVSEDDVLEWAYEAYESLAPREVFDVDVAMIQVHNHVGQLPKGLFNLELVLYRDETAMKHSGSVPYTNTETDCEVTKEFNKGCVTETTITTIVETSKPVLPVNNVGKLVTSNNGVITERYTYFNNIIKKARWKPLIPSGNVMHNSILFGFPADFYTGCTHSFSVKNNCIVTTFEHGVLAIAFTGLPKDDDDDYLIPDYEFVLKALETHCLRRFWQRKMNVKEEGAGSLYQLYREECELYMPKATAELMKPNMLEYQRYRNMNKFRKEDSPVATMLGALNNREIMYFGEYSRNFNSIVNTHNLGL